jgi:hypothetical protein
VRGQVLGRQAQVLDACHWCWLRQSHTAARQNHTLGASIEKWEQNVPVLTTQKCAQCPQSKSYNAWLNFGQAFYFFFFLIERKAHSHDLILLAISLVTTSGDSPAGDIVYAAEEPRVPAL